MQVIILFLLPRRCDSLLFIKYQLVSVYDIVLLSLNTMYDIPPGQPASIISLMVDYGCLGIGVDRSFWLDCFALQSAALVFLSVRFNSDTLLVDEDRRIYSLIGETLNRFMPSDADRTLRLTTSQKTCRRKNVVT